MNGQNPAPYPPLRIQRRDPSLLPLLFGLYTGGRGELTAALRYRYQALCSRRDPELCRAFSELADSEFCHLEILGRLIALLGGDPVYYDPQTRSFWTGRQVPSWGPDAVCRMLLQDLREEVAAVDRYLAAARRIPDQKIAAMFRRIAADEVTHGQVLRSLLQNRCPRRPGPQALSKRSRPR